MIRPLTSLRFFAAALVVFSHLGFLATSQSPRLVALFDTVFREGYIGVTFFFVLSGFILSFSYDGRLNDGQTTPRAFWLARFARIYPLHLLTLLIALPLAVLGMSAERLPVFFVQLVSGLSLTQALNPMQEVFFSLNMPAWSLSVEMVFYLLFPLLCAARSAVLWAVVALVVVGQATVIALHLDAHFLIYIFPPARLADFVTGVLLFRVYRARPVMSRIGATSLQAASVVWIVAAVAMKDSISQALRYDLYYLPPMALMVLAFAWTDGMLARMISGRMAVFLGKASFAVYMVHQLVIRYGEAIRRRLFDDHTDDVLFSIWYFAASIALASALYLFFERRMRAAILARIQLKA